MEEYTRAPADAARPQSAKEIISAHFGEFLVPTIYEKIFSDTGWEEIVGGKIAECSRPIDIIDSVLVVAVDHPAWGQHIKNTLPQIIQKIKTTSPETKIKGIKIRLTQGGK